MTERTGASLADVVIYISNAKSLPYLLVAGRIRIYLFNNIVLFLQIFYVLPMIRASGKSANNTCEASKMLLGPCRKVIKLPLLEEISEKMSDKQLQYDCELEDAALGKLLLDADVADFYLKLFPQANGTTQLQFNEKANGAFVMDIRFIYRTRTETTLTHTEANDFVSKAVQSWSSRLEEMKTNTSNAAKYGCNFAVEKGFRYTLLCLFS
ncbi:hypothetical protein Y032_0018g3621 [Ancylostoma ceylanicum]|uniref:Uncharacterized protein n=1 Tax=Ancylostoma ceylanicum TaxID=53326 RepID=A0A016V3B3_9BILA|nr:hypothetical protein Y032_0018g3621 [Ancylostoma ceylanicum]